MTHLEWGVLAFDYLFWGGASFLSGTSSGVGIFAVTAEFVKDCNVFQQSGPSAPLCRRVTGTASDGHSGASAISAGNCTGSSSTLEWGIQEWEYLGSKIQKLEWHICSPPVVALDGGWR